MQEADDPAATIRPMNARLRTFVLLLATVATLFTLALGPAMATESGPAGGGEEDGKVSLPSDPHDQVGLIILGVVGVFALGAGINAVRQLKGTRPQADGRIRWR